MFGKYKNAFLRLSDALIDISARYKKCKSFFYWDAMWANIIYGITPNQYIGWKFYSKSRLERSTFYTRRHFLKLEPRLNSKEFYNIFWNKALFNQTFSEFIKRDWLFVPEASDFEILNFLKKYPKIIVKPTCQSAGKGIHVYSSNESLDELKAGGVLLEECICQCKEMAQLNPSSVNSIRIYSMLDKKNQPHILSACIRVGGKGSTTDNFHSGGVAYPIDVDHGVVCGQGSNMVGENFLYHPGTEAKVIGFEIPRWNELVSWLFKAAVKIEKARMIAWDVAVLEDGFELIEANYNGDPGVMQTPLQQGTLLKIKEYM